MKLVKRYALFLITLVIIGAMILVDRPTGLEATSITLMSLRQMLFIIPPVFVLLGLLDIWVPRKTMVKYMGEDSGLKGVLLAILLGSAAAGPLYAAFPVAAVFMKKGVKFSNIMVFIGAWSTTKIPMLMFELAALGPKFALTRLAVDIPGIIIIAYILARMVSKEQVQEMYKKAESL